jgi:hypothetical protein
MVKHIVMWTLKESAQGRSRAENARMMKEKLEALVGIVPGLLRAEIGVDFERSEQSYDVALYAEMDSRESLHIYQSHPAHLAAVAFIREVRDQRCVVDYEV